eukprot:TRINITY_DN883_c0_g1_i1.p3 TRINITY_DN883_c0_g1~~TRINITY_DN883_c0_g1_i1.p3  ORF type:complete len:102 (-),score=28.95 TRINITY_DN883_c0_g1_i1:82-387(-)
MNDFRLDLIALAFDKFDSNDDGKITMVDIQQKYNARQHPKWQSGEWTEEEVFGEFLKNFDDQENPDGVITHEEFVNYYAGVSASIDNDMYFDLLMRKAWNL